MLNFNDFINSKVIHKTWGSGTIESFGEKSLVVHFQYTNEGERSVPFVFPNAFVSEFIKMEDTSKQARIEHYIKNNACVFCKKSDIETHIVSGFRVCKYCETEHLTKCYICKALFDKSKAVKAYIKDNSCDKGDICPECAATSLFLCEECNRYHWKDVYKEYKYKNSTLCYDCIVDKAEQCFFCKEYFDFDEVTWVNSSEYWNVNVCTECKKKHTFTCTQCDELTIIEERADSKYVPASMNVCQRCLYHCSHCDKYIDKEHITEAFGAYYCTDCWEKIGRECKICGDNFASKNGDELCPDCIEMRNYESRIKNIDLSSCGYKSVSSYGLDYVDRCKLFTELYIFCTKRNLEYYINKSEPFEFIELNLLGYNLIVTYLDDNIIGKHKHSTDLTMTELRSGKGRSKVYNNVEKWKKTSRKFINTAAGKMRILNYPVQLRVQTEFDKIYGKEWNGPDDYIEIGNYGDTTNFYIIGFLTTDD